MTKRALGALLGLFAGWFVSVILQRAFGWIGANLIWVLLTMLIGTLIGASVGGLYGGVAGAIAGLVLGGLAVRVVFWILRLSSMLVGAALGWHWAAADD